MSRSPKALDLFSGCGGFSTGLLDAGVEVVAGFDIDRRSIEAFDYNHSYRSGKGHVLDLSTATGRDVMELAGLSRVDLIVGGPPCQPFSIVGKQRGLEDERGNLVLDFIRLVGEIRPTAVIFENVANLSKMSGGKLLKVIVSRLEALGYLVAHDVLCVADYGVPQIRKRLFVVALRTRRRVVFPQPTHAQESQGDLFGRLKRYVTCRQVLGDLPDVGDPRARSFYNHEPTLHSPEMLAAFEKLLPGCRDRKSFHDRLHPDRPSYTLRAGTGNFSPLRPVHYQYHRVISVRESARIQGFSDDFIWPDWIPRLQQYRQVGNAVPPPIAKRLAESLAANLGWHLEPSRLKGDPSNRASPITRSDEEKAAERARRMRGASLGLSARRKEQLGNKAGIAAE